ncbi:PREDICTED: pentatricopeptide repeat-containing protein At2g22070-like [Nelumbo nucifera]|uniref:Pentatricopeptide repeat-containing protein At2g22070-like n=1 Tax=Nelumbo nucifera TaxID=4432 RepID=A0A1U7ZT06_NELNU|nr:PREDICTED: pentatricopeptide repeat-containing protein At2g22070-like [Nelumbo nucifera]
MFEAMPVRDVVSCNLVIASHARHGFPELALDLFKEMVSRGLRESPSTCSSFWVFAVMLGSTEKLFDELPSRSLAMWNLVLRGFCQLGRSYEVLGFYLKIKSDVGVDPNGVTFYYLIYACARHRMGREGLKMLETMIQEGLKPDAITFLFVLMSCSHSCLVREGQLIFESIENIHVVYLDRRHYSCMVDLLGRACLLEEAEVLLKCSPVKDDLVMWSSLLRSCIVHRNEKVGRTAAIALLELDLDNPTVLLQASSFYSEIGDIEMSMKIREYKKTSEMRKGAGYSFIESINHGYS